MYLGASEKLQKKIQEFNKNSNWIILSQSDLFPTYKDVRGKSYNIESIQLRQKLGEIISQQKTSEDNIWSSPTIIEIEFPKDQIKLKPGPWDYGWWFIVKKEYIYQQARKNGGKKLTLMLETKKGNWEHNHTGLLSEILGDSSYADSPEWKEIVEQEKKINEKKTEEFWALVHSAIQEINQKAKLGNIALEEAIANMDYQDLQPDYCFCGGSPSEQKEFHNTHIASCLGSKEKVNQFKAEIIEIIERSIINLNQKRKNIIEKTEEIIKDKQIKFDWNHWKELINKEETNERLDFTEKIVNNLVKKLIEIQEKFVADQEKLAEETRKFNEENRKRQAETNKEWERLKKEKEENRKKADQKAREREEKTKKENQKREKQEKFINEKREKIEEKLKKLQQRIRDLENEDDHRLPMEKEQEKQKIEKEIWDLRMGKFSENHRIESEEQEKFNESPKKSEINYFAVSLCGVVSIIFILVIVMGKTKKNR